MLLAGGGVEIEGGSEERKPPTARQDGSYYALSHCSKVLVGFSSRNFNSPNVRCQKHFLMAK